MITTNKISSKFLIFISVFTLLLTSYEKELFSVQTYKTKNEAIEIMKKMKIRNEIKDLRTDYKKAVEELRRYSPFSGEMVKLQDIVAWKKNQAPEFAKAYDIYIQILGNKILSMSLKNRTLHEGLAEQLLNLDFQESEIVELLTKLKSDDSPFPSSNSINTTSSESIFSMPSDANIYMHEWVTPSEQ